MKRCAHCGGEVSDTARACGHCGRWLATGPAGVAADPQAGRRCPHCRELVPASAQACANCGEWLEPGPSARRRIGRGLPVWGLVLIGFLGAILVVGATYVVMNRWPVWQQARLAPTPNSAGVQPTATSGAVASEATPSAVASLPTDTPIPPEPTAIVPMDAPAPATHTPVPPTDTPLPTSTETPRPSPPPSPTDKPPATGTAAPPAESPTPTTEPAPEPPPADTVPAELSGRIAFPVFDPERGTYDLYVAKPDGSGLRLLMSEASQPALNPDGQRVAFRRWRGDDRGLEVMSMAGTDQRRFTKFLEDALPSWSANGETLVFFSRRESDRKSRVYQVDVVQGGDWELKQGVDPIWGEYPTWHPDGSIVYRATWPDHGLAAMNSDGSEKRMILADGSATAPAISPDGQVIALMSQRDGNWEIYRINEDGSGLQRLTDHRANDGLPTWSPDGAIIAFVSDRGGSWGIWAMTASGEGLRRLFVLPGSPDGMVRNQPDFSTRGWAEERISWGP